MAEYILPKEQLIKLIRYDCEAFFGFYLGEELTLDVPEFHKEIWDELLELLDQINDPEMLTGTLHKLIGVPREHSKTTTIKLACVLLLRYSRLSFLAYISNTFNAGLNAVKDIHAFFRSQQDQDLYGPWKHEKASEQVGEFLFSISTPLSSKPKDIIMKAFGVSTQIRGTVIKNRRPDLMVFDDCESRETADSPVQQAKLDAWCLGTALKSMAKLGVAIFIGNMLTDTSLLARLSKEPSWNATVFGSIVRDQHGNLRPLWDGRWTLEALLDEYASYRRLGNGHIWEAEMMNLTAKEILGESMENAIRVPYPPVEKIQAGFICLDPAFGENAWHDFSAITVHALVEGVQTPVIVDYWHGRAKEEGLLDEMIRLSFIWGIGTWCIESVAAQKLLLKLFKLLLVTRGMSPETFLMIPVTPKGESKPARIVAFRTAVAKESYAIAENCEEVFTKLSDYVPGVEHDDLEDSSAYGTLVWDLHGILIKGLGRQDIAGAIFEGKSPAAVVGIDMGM